MEHLPKAEDCSKGAEYIRSVAQRDWRNHLMTVGAEGGEWHGACRWILLALGDVSLVMAAKRRWRRPFLFRLSNRTRSKAQMLLRPKLELGWVVLLPRSLGTATLC